MFHCQIYMDFKLLKHVHLRYLSNTVQQCGHKSMIVSCYVQKITTYLIKSLNFGQLHCKKTNKTFYKEKSWEFWDCYRVSSFIYSTTNLISFSSVTTFLSFPGFLLFFGFLFLLTHWLTATFVIYSINNTVIVHLYWAIQNTLNYRSYTYLQSLFNYIELWYINNAINTDMLNFTSIFFTSFTFVIVFWH